MAVKALEIHPSALAEFKSAVAWYLERNESAAKKFVAEVDGGIDLLLRSPSRWPRGEHSTRKLIVRRFPFAIVYREKVHTIQIVAIAHGHRRPGYWKDRL